MSDDNVTPPRTLVSRRRLAVSATAGAAALILAACGVEESDDPEADDANLLNQILATELALVEVATGSAAVQAKQNVTDLESAIEQLGVPPIETPAGDASSADDAEGAALDAGLGAVGGLTRGDLRKLVYGIVIGHATQIAAVNAAAGEPIAPAAFVLGSSS